MEFRKYFKKDIIARLHYNPNFDDNSYNNQNTRCYVYPLFLNENGNYSSIEPEDFPTQGRIEVRIQNSESAEDVFNRLKSLVRIKINNAVDPNEESSNYYSLKYHSGLNRERSEIWIEKIPATDFYQVLEVEVDITELQYLDKRLISKPDAVNPNLMVLPNHIMLRLKDGGLYGPFEYDIKEDQMELKALREYRYSVGKYDLNELKNNFLDIKGEGIECTLCPKKCFCKPEECEINYDWIDKNTLIDNLVDALRTENSFTHKQVQQLKDMAHHLIKNSMDLKFTDFRVEKIQRIISEIDENSSTINGIVQYALKNEHMKHDIIEEIIGNYFDRIEPQLNEFNIVQEKIDELRTKKNELENDVSDLQSKKEKIENRNLSTKQVELKNLNEKIEIITKENESLKEKLELQENVDALKREKVRLKSAIVELENNYDQSLLRNEKLKAQFRDKLNEFNDEAKQIARIIDSKLLDQILQGLGEEVIENGDYKFDTSFLINEQGTIDGEYIINRVKDYIEEKAHRVVEYNEVANYLICLTQGFVTTFAGEPGTGKTSLCNILAKALGLTANPKQKRFVDISVERGWTSHKDFIGYYNPLTKRIEKSNNDVYDAFIQLDSECGTSENSYDPSAVAPFIILLDEANLSPIEHYWAAFLRNCDMTTSNKTISLGGNGILQIPDHLRFFATVNFDHTTEELSPRFLDRSWIITLEPTNIDSDTEEELCDSDSIISFGDLISAFKNKDENNIDDSINSKWNAIQKIFRESRLPIAPRNLKMVKNYCSVACKCMKQDDTQTKFAPLDYAFSQKILPTISGTGDNYKRLIEELLKECTDEFMPISAKHLERIKIVAENNMGYYQFFAR